MRLYNIVIVVAATAGSIGAASPSHRHHQHKHSADKRSPSHVTVVTMPGPTVVAYELNGELVTESEVCDGIKSGKLKWADSGNVPEVCSSVAAVAEPATTSATSVSVAPVEAYQKPSTTPEPSSVAAPEPQTTSSSSSVAAPEPAAPSPNTDRHSSSSSGGGSSYSFEHGFNGGQGLDKSFPDNEIDCSEFPSDYGAIEIPWMNIGGWAGIQYVTIDGDTVTHIDTAVPGGKNCTTGAMCSYACPPGYQKSQWPSTQGSTGQSVGGLQCNENNKLCLTNKALSDTLCVKGTGATKVKNTMSKNAAICRTDYPGTESETVPLNTQPGSTSPLTCPDSKSYFKHNNDPTTAQYYINNAGVSVEEACIWGTDGTGKGNWAPSYLGVGQDLYGKTWLSISSTAQNMPTNYQPLDYTVEIQGDNLSGTCRLSGGKYCSGANYDDCNDQGCTVELMSGDATYVLSS